MDFTISHEQRDLKETARRFARQEMAAVAKRIEAEDEPLSRDWLERYAEMGFLGINVSATYAGLASETWTPCWCSRNSPRSRPPSPFPYSNPVSVRSAPSSTWRART